MVEFFPRSESLHGDAPSAVIDLYGSLGLRLELLDVHGVPRPSDPGEILAADEVLVTLVLRPS